MIGSLRSILTGPSKSVRGDWCPLSDHPSFLAEKVPLLHITLGYVATLCFLRNCGEEGLLSAPAHASHALAVAAFALLVLAKKKSKIAIASVVCWFQSAQGRSALMTLLEGKARPEGGKSKRSLLCKGTRSSNSVAGLHESDAAHVSLAFPSFTLTISSYPRPVLSSVPAPRRPFRYRANRARVPHADEQRLCSPCPASERMCSDACRPHVPSTCIAGRRGEMGTFLRE